MKISKTEPIAVGIPMLEPVVMAGEEVRRADNMLVRIETDDGAVGWGEAASAPTMTGETLESMVAAVRLLAPTLDGREPGDIEGALRAMDERLYGNHGAKAAVEIALHDLVGRATRRPVHALLGEKRHARVPLLGVVGGGDVDGDLADAARKKADGYTLFKIKVGVDTPSNDAERTRAICKRLGAGFIISADANQGFDMDEALAYLRAVAGAGLDFFEQPVRADDIAGMAAVAAASDVAIGADEGIHALADIRRHHAHKAAQGVSLKAIKLGGLKSLVAAGRLCGELGMRVNVSCKTGETSIACAAALHAASVLPDLAWGLTLTHGGLRDDIVTEPIRVTRGWADVPDRPGLGLEVDEDRVRRCRIEVATRAAVG